MGYSEESIGTGGQLEFAYDELELQSTTESIAQQHVGLWCYDHIVVLQAFAGNVRQSHWS
jgi:hypothetical protein